MPRLRLNIIGPIVLLLATVGGGWAATNLIQQTVPIVPGVQGCWRLEGSARQVGCLSKEFSNGADLAAGKTDGAARDEAVIEYVRRAERLASSDTQLAGTCHPSMHDLGRREGARAAGEGRVPGFPGGSSQLCTAGYVHGLAEGYLASKPGADVAMVFPKLCHDDAAVEGCAHGVGHALVRSELKQSAPDISADRSVEACGDIPAKLRSDCTNGVYMEIAMRTSPEPVSVRDFSEICGDLDDSDRELSCWSYLSLSFSANDVGREDIPTWCARAPLPAQFTCIEGYGRQLGVRDVAECSKVSGPPPLRERCIDGAVGLQVGSGHVAASDAKSSCSSLQGDGLRGYCRRAVARYTVGRKAVEAT